MNPNGELSPPGRPVPLPAAQGGPRDRLLPRRAALELGHAEAWLSQGRSRFHWENVDWLRRVVRLGLGLSGLLPRGQRNALRLVVNHLPFRFATLPEAFHGFRILHLSDLHIDGLADLAAAICDKIRGLEVDLCVLTGDYRFEVHGPYHTVYRYVEQVLACVKSRHGIVGILGNHDFYEVVPELERMGVTMLINQSLEVRQDGASIWLLGLDDAHYYGCDDLPQALAVVPEGAFKVLLVHSPEMLVEAAKSQVDLYLCGHTHAGQIRLPWFGPLLVNARCARRYVQGAWTFEGVQGYTSAGAGSSCVPVRFFCPPEIGVIELQRVS